MKNKKPEYFQLSQLDTRFTEIDKYFEPLNGSSYSPLSQLGSCSSEVGGYGDQIYRTDGVPPEDADTENERCVTTIRITDQRHLPN